MEELKTNEYLRGIVMNLPTSPGIYQYLNAEGTIIYVGKAKNLKRRVYSYFSKDHHSAKTRILVSRIADIRYIVVNTEEDALLLENNLIKKYKPRYNVLLKDDKSYPSICVSNEYFPRVFKTRKIVRDGSTYFGPYTHFPSMQAMLDLIKRLYPLRTCHLALTPENIQAGKFRVCLEYHIKNCKGPCIGAQSHEEYMANIASIKELLKGNTQKVSQGMMQEMMRLADEMRFEEAQLIKEKYELIENYRSKSEVVSSVLHNIDVFSIEDDEQSAYINYLHITNGCINQTFTIPQRGDKKHLLELSILNVKQYKVDRLKQAEKLNPEQRSVRLLKEIQEQLHMDKMPLHIECFDNSNIQGADAVAACVVFKKGRPSKQDYRKYIIKTVVGPDDYASMQEVVRRRYTRILEEQGELPDLILTDGGKGQMEVVRQVIEDELSLHIPIAGLAKDNKHRTSEILFGFPPRNIGLKQGTPLFHLLENIQNEVHRFAITFHRDKRSKSQIASALDGIKGVGKMRKEALLKHFKSVARIKKASLEELAEVVGMSVAQTIKETL